MAELVKKYMDRGMNRSMATRAARKKLASTQEAEYRGGNVDATEILVEALSTEEGQMLIEGAVREQFAAIVAPVLSDLVEAALEDERDSIRTEAAQNASRMLRVRDLRDAAHAQIRESKLPGPFQDELRGKYDLREDEPTDALDVEDETDEETGAVAKTAEEKIREAIEGDIEVKREQIAAVNPTRVSGQGPTAAPKKKAEGEGEDEAVEETKSSGSRLTDEVLAEASFTPDDIAEMYQGI